MAKPRVTICVACGSNRVGWRVGRRGVTLPPSMRELHWCCRECGNQWTEPLLAGTEDGEDLEVPPDA